MTDAEHLIHRLPPISILKLAALHVMQESLAELIHVEPHDAVIYTGPDKRAQFKPTARLLKAASQGLSFLVVSTAPATAGDIRDDLQAKLVSKFGVPAATAAAALNQLVAQKVLSTIEQSPKTQFDNQCSLIGSRGLKDGRL
jgi:hypothetical protein